MSVVPLGHLWLYNMLLVHGSMNVYEVRQFILPFYFRHLHSSSAMCVCVINVLTVQRRKLQFLSPCMHGLCGNFPPLICEKIYWPLAIDSLRYYTVILRYTYYYCVALLLPGWIIEVFLINANIFPVADHIKKIDQQDI